MHGDHSPRPVHSFLSFFSRRSSSSRQAQSSPANNSTHAPSSSQYEPHRPMSPPQIQTTGAAPADATLPLPSPQVFVPRPMFADVLLSKSSAPSSDHLPSPSPSRRLFQGLATAPGISLKPSASTSRQNRRSRPSTPQYEVEHHPTSDQSMNFSAVQSVHQHSLVDPPPHLPHHVHHLPLPPPPAEQVTKPGTPLGQLSSNQGSSRSQHRDSDLFYQAHDFVINDPVFVDNSSDNFMASFLKETIRGAEFDSSDPMMPLRCHPGTRLEIIKQCQDFILNRDGRPKLRWVVGAAGVGKSAIMQSVAQDEYNILSDIIVGATIFFSINGRQDGTKTITTIAYQLAVKLYSYRLFIQREVTHDPSLLQKSLSRQFKKFIVEPFIDRCILDRPSRLLIIIDGLDECASPLTQKELLGLISDFCITSSSSPIVWMIASRPEPHITSFFSRLEVTRSYEKEEILVDSDDAHEDVKRYLRDKFREVRMASITLRPLPQWPSEDDFFKVAEASGGLFAYASTVIKYINDPSYGDPVGQLDDVLNVIDAGAKFNVSGDDHPMAQLDALYAHIMSQIPAKVMVNTRKILLLYVGGPFLDNDPLRLKCNILGIAENTAYGATHHIRAVAIVPGPDEAAYQRPEFYHKSFPDYLRDFNRSGFSPDLDSETQQLMNQCALRIVEEAPDGVYMDGASWHDLHPWGGTLKNGPGTGDNISLSWPAVGEHDNRKLRFEMFRHAIWQVVLGLGSREEDFKSLLCMRVLTTCFAELSSVFPFDAFSDSVFDESWRRELIDHGILKQVLLETLDYDKTPIDKLIKLCFRSPLSDPWNTSCEHGKEGSWEGHSQDWSTAFIGPRGQIYTCDYCLERFVQQSRMQLPGQLVTVCNITPVNSFVELRFVDPDDDVSEWIYHFLIKNTERQGGLSDGDLH